MTPFLSTISGLDPERLPPEGLAFNPDTGALSYNVDGTGAVVQLTVEDAWTLAQAITKFIAGQYVLGQIPTSGRA